MKPDDIPEHPAPLDDQADVIGGDLVRQKEACDPVALSVKGDDFQCGLESQGNENVDGSEKEQQGSNG